VPRLSCTYGQFIEILLRLGFQPDNRKASSHVRYRGTYGGLVRFVDVSGHGNTDIPTGTLLSMLRQSGLPKHLFRK